MTVTDTNTLLLVAGAFGIVIGICISGMAAHREIATLKSSLQAVTQMSINHQKSAQRYYLHTRCLIVAGAGLTRSITLLRARKQGIGATVDTAVNAWVAVRIKAESLPE